MANRRRNRRKPANQDLPNFFGGMALIGAAIGIAVAFAYTIPWSTI